MRDTKNFDLAAAWIEQQKPTGTNLALGLRYRLTGEVLQEDYSAAKTTLGQFIDAINKPALYGHSEILAFDQETGLQALTELASVLAATPQSAAQWRNWVVLSITLPRDTIIVGCGSGPKAKAYMKISLQRKFAQTLLGETKHLAPKDRARRLAASLKGLTLYAYSGVKEVIQTIHQLDPDGAYLSLDKHYHGKHWLTPIN